MQRRFPIGFFTIFGEALAAKTKEMLENPNNTYQIRKSSTGGKKGSSAAPKDVFNLVQRVTASEADQVIHTAQKLKRRKKHRVKNYQG